MIDANKSNREEILFLTLNILYNMPFMIFFPTENVCAKRGLQTPNDELLLLTIRDPPWKNMQSDKEYTEIGASFINIS